MNLTDADEAKAQSKADLERDCAQVAELSRLFLAIKDQKQRRVVMDLARRLADPSEEKADLP